MKAPPRSIVAPLALTAFANAMIIIDAIAPRTGIEHLVGIGILDVSVKNLLREVAVEQVDLMVVVVAAQQRG